MTIHGTAGNDHLTGTSKADTFDLTQGGEDNAKGLGGNDTFRMGATFDAGDRIDGGSGDDTLVLSGADYTAGLANITSIDTIKLGDGHSYTLTAAAGTVAKGATMTVDASALGESDQFVFDGTAEKNGSFHVIIGDGDNHFFGGGGDDIVDASADGTYGIDLSKGGNDTVLGHEENGSATDFAVGMGAALNAGDHLVDVGQIELDGNYAGSRALTLAAGTIVDAVVVTFDAGHSYDLTLAAANVGAGNQTTFDSQALGAHDTLVLDASAVAGDIIVDSGDGDDVLRGGSGNDTFFLQGGKDQVFGGDGSDTIVATEYNGKTDVDGGAGNDTLELTAATGTVEIGKNIVSIETLQLADGSDYQIVAADALVVKGASLTVDASTLSAALFIDFDGHLEKDGSFQFIGGAGEDEFTGGKGNDTIYGGLGQDELSGGAGKDTFAFISAADSTSVNFDVLNDFDGNQDKIALPFTLKHLNLPITGGSLDKDTFDNDIANAVTGHLGKHQAIEWTPGAGDYANDHFLIVDGNGQPGYQVGEDYVMVIDATTIHKSDFVVLDTGF